MNQLRRIFLFLALQLPVLAIGTLLFVAGCPLPTECNDLVYDPDINQCVCPPGSVPRYDLGECELEDGTFIPWVENVPYARTDAGADASFMDAGMDTAPLDMSIDAPMDEGPDVPDMPPLAPANVTARYPHNGFASGSIHVPDAEPIVNHPLRPKFMWNEVADADHYQIQLTRECDVEGFRECAFSRLDLDAVSENTTFHPETSLTVSRIAPVGSRYYWRVRACSEEELCSDWTEVRYLNVGRDDRDYNGDGYADVLVGAPIVGRFVGRAYVYFGSAAGPSTVPDVTFSDPGERRSPVFGFCVATGGDVNADGFADAIVGSGNGSTVLYLGSTSGPSPSPSTIWERNTDSIAAGDLNGDGYSDVVLGRHFDNTDRGIDVYYGATMVSTAPDLRVSAAAAQANGGFGISSDTGDFDGDGYVDLAVGSHQHDDSFADEGVVFIFRGTETGLESVPSTELHAGTPQTSAEFGYSVRDVGDSDADGFADLLVGAWAEDSESDEADAGAAYLFHGGPSGFRPATAIHGEGIAADDGFGRSTAGLGDLDGDGYDELGIGVRGVGESRLHRAYIFVHDSDPLFLDQPEGIAGFGFELAGVGDVNGDGYADVMIGALTDQYSGRVLGYFGSPAGLPLTPMTALNATLNWGLGARIAD